MLVPTAMQAFVVAHIVTHVSAFLDNDLSRNRRSHKRCGSDGSSTQNYEFHFSLLWIIPGKATHNCAKCFALSTRLNERILSLRA
jgi:hypothetical protein